ncbi:MAG: hypothetical protein R3D89_07120 [Sphingomonadaceae bacterium]|jgi:hypothetical protein
MHKIQPLKQTRLGKASVPLLIAGWLSFFAVGGYFAFSHKSDPPHLTVKQHELVADMENDGLGKQRREALEEATRHYVDAHPEADAAMREGKAFAPVEFINEELATKGAHWRVRKIDGLKAQIYEVS